MRGDIPPKDLVVLAADKNAEFAIRGILKRYAAIGIRPINADIYVHPERDPGCLLKADVFLAAFRQSHNHAIVIFDRAGCGQEHLYCNQLKEQVVLAIERTGWNRSLVDAIVLDPELEIWVWSDSPEVDKSLGWHLSNPDLRTWLRTNRYLDQNSAKPLEPKEAMEAALRQVRRARSSSIFQQLAETVSVHRCTDLAFARLKETLMRWFPAN